MRVAILTTDGFEQSELTDPRKALDETGGDDRGRLAQGQEVRGWSHKEWRLKVGVDQPLQDADPRDYHAWSSPREFPLPFGEFIERG